MDITNLKLSSDLIQSILIASPFILSLAHCAYSRYKTNGSKSNTIPLVHTSRKGIYDQLSFVQAWEKSIQIRIFGLLFILREDSLDLLHVVQQDERKV